MNVLDKEEFRIKLEEINHLVEKKDYKGAMNVVDSIDWRRVKNVRTLCVVGEIYAANKRYEDSREIFLLAYHRASIGKNILYRLIEVSLKMGDVDEAMEFYNEFKEVSPNDNTKYILKYKIYKAKGASLNEQIKILEDYKEREFTEKWAYELARLYYNAGDREKCLNLCNEMVLWFSEGSYVMKALDLKMRMGVLTGEEKEKYEKQFIPKLLTPEDAKELKKDPENKAAKAASAETEEEKEGPQIESIRIRSDRDLRGAETLQERISKGIRDIFEAGKKKEETEEAAGDNEAKEEEIPSEIIRTPSSGEEFVNVPKLEKEGEDKKMPELKIPESMKNINLQEKAPVPELTAPSFIMGSMDEIAASEEPQEESGNPEEQKLEDFNLEDTILAAATAQGIDIPEKEEAPEEETEEKAEETVKETEENTVSQDEDVVTEEDLQKAEEEFFRGPEDIKTVDEDVFEEEIISGLLNENMQEEAQEEPSLEEMNLSEEEELEQFIESIQPKEEKDILDIIPREQNLTEDEKKLFTYFVKVPGMKEQLVDTLTDVQLSAADPTSRTGNIIVMGGKETGKTRLISSLIPAICKELNLEASKVAYVFAEQINGKDIPAIVKKLSGGFLVIENANQLAQETAEQLDRAMEQDTEGMIVIVEDEKIGMRKFMARFPKLAKKFTSTLNIPVFTNDELVTFANVYTRENGYKIDQMGMLALYNLIGVNQKEDEPMSIGAVKEIIDNAIAKSQGGIRKLKRNISKKRMDRDGFIMLYEKDFS